MVLMECRNGRGRGKYVLKDGNENNKRKRRNEKSRKTSKGEKETAEQGPSDVFGITRGTKTGAT